MTSQQTLGYVIKDGKILLMMKKRGFGAGKWNGPGGKIEKDESPHEGISREMFEEIGVRPVNHEKCGEICFHFLKDDKHDEKPDINVHVFVANDFEGEIQESDESRPKWFSIDELPYDNMWSDDVHWMPLMLDGKKFNGKFFFDKKGVEILKMELNEV